MYTELIDKFVLAYTLHSIAIPEGAYYQCM